MCRSLVRFWDLKTALRDAVIGYRSAPGNGFEGELSELDTAKTVFLREHGVGSGLLVVPE